MKPHQKQNSRTESPSVTTKLATSSSRRTIPEQENKSLSFSDVIPRSSPSFSRPANPNPTQPKEEENERALLKTAMILDFGDADPSVEFGTQIQQEENSPPFNQTNTSSSSTSSTSSTVSTSSTSSTLTSTFTPSFTSTPSVSKINTSSPTKKQSTTTSSETTNDSSMTSSPLSSLNKQSQTSLKKPREGMTLKKKTSARDLSPSKNSSPSSSSSSSEAPLLRRSRSMIFELANFQKEVNKSPNSSPSASSETKKKLASTFRLFDRKLLMRKMLTAVFNSTEGTADEEMRVLTRSVSESAITYLFGMEPGPVRTSTGIRPQGSILWEVEKTTTRATIVNSFPRPRSKSLPDHFRFYAPDADPIIITRERRMTITAPTLSFLLRMRSQSFRKGVDFTAQEPRSPRSRTQSMGSHTSSEKLPSEGNLSDDEDDVQREVEDTRELVETLKIEGDPLTMPLEEITKRMAQEEKEDFANVNFDEDTGSVCEGTLRALIRQMIVELKEMEFLDSFLLTYDIFIDSLSLLKALLLLYRVPLVSSDYLSMCIGRRHSESVSIPATTPPPSPLSLPSLRTRHESTSLRKDISDLVARRGSSPVLSTESDSNKSPVGSGLLRKRDTPSKSATHLLENIKSKRDSPKELSTPPLIRRASHSSTSSSENTPPRSSSSSREDVKVHGLTANVVSSVVSGSPGLDDPIARQRIVLQYRIVRAIIKWLELRYEKLRNNKEWNKLFNAFIEKLNSGSQKEKTWANQLQNTMKEVQNTRAKLKKFMKMPVPYNPGHTLEFIDIPLEELAEQMCLLEQKYFFRLKLKELANRAWTKPDADRLSPNVRRMIDHFNQNSYWVASTVVLAPGWGQVGPKQRAEIISRFIKLMEIFAQLHNYNGILQIYSALNMNCVERLKKAWSLVPQKLIDKMKEYGQLVSNANNYKLYREKIEFVEPPAIPLQEVLLRDIFFIDDRNETVLENGWINFAKMVMLGRVYQKIRRFQKVPYNFKENNAIQWYLKHRIILSEDDLFLGSKNAEPKRNTHEVKVEAAKAREQRKRLKQLEKQSESPEKIKKPAEKDEKRKRKESQSLTKLKTKHKSPASPGTKKTERKELMLDDIFTDRKLYSEFQSYLVSKYSDENLEFYDQVQNVYKKLDFVNTTPENQKKIKDTAQKLYERFIQDGAPRQVALSDLSVAKISKMTKPNDIPTKDYFEPAVCEVKFNLVASFRSFLESRK